MVTILPRITKNPVHYGSFVFLMLLFLFSVSCFAAGAISQSYSTKSVNISKGALLSLVANGTTEVVLSSNSNATNLVGVAADNPLVELSSSEANDVRVVVGGTTEVLVSDINGAVKAGDKITVSPVSGIGMKAVGASEIIGTAQASLTSISTVNQIVVNQNGKRETVKVGLLPVNVNVDYYAVEGGQGTVASFVPPFLQSVANAIAGRQVSPLRVLLGITALLLGFSAVIVILYTSIRSGLISLGRNPLAQGALRKGLVDVIIAAIALLIITVGLIYIILTV